MFIFNSLKLYFIIIPIFCLLLLLINILLSERETYSEKKGPFECGFHSWNQTRNTFSVAFVLVALLFLPFDLEVTSVLPYALTLYSVGIYGLILVVLFCFLLGIGFVFEINNDAIKIRINWSKSYDVRYLMCILSFLTKDNKSNL